MKHCFFVKQKYNHTSDTCTAEISCLIFHGLSKMIVTIDVCCKFKFWMLNVKQNYIHTSDNGTAEISCLIDWSFLLTLVLFFTFHEALLFLSSKSITTHLTLVRPRYRVWSFMAFQSWLSQSKLIGLASSLLWYFMKRVSFLF